MGLDRLIEAMATLVCQVPDVLLLIGGSGSQRAALEALVRALGLDKHVTFLGFVPEGDLPRYYQAADVFVLPTRELEGFGLVTAEALACGTPVLGTPVGATPELLEPLDAGLVFRDATAEAMAEDLAVLLTRLAAIRPGPRACGPPAAPTRRRASAGSTSSTSWSGRCVTSRAECARSRRGRRLRGVRRRPARLQARLRGAAIRALPALRRKPGRHAADHGPDAPRVPGRATPAASRPSEIEPARRQMLAGIAARARRAGRARPPAGRRLRRRPLHGGRPRRGLAPDRQRSLATTLRDRAPAGRRRRSCTPTPRRFRSAPARSTRSRSSTCSTTRCGRARSCARRRGCCGRAAC